MPRTAWKVGRSAFVSARQFSNTTEALHPARLLWLCSWLRYGHRFITHLCFQQQSLLDSQWQLLSSAPPPERVCLAHTCLISQGWHPRGSASSARRLNFNVHPPESDAPCCSKLPEEFVAREACSYCSRSWMRVRSFSFKDTHTHTQNISLHPQFSEEDLHHLPNCFVFVVGFNILFLFGSDYLTSCFGSSDGWYCDTARIGFFGSAFSSSCCKHTGYKSCRPCKMAPPAPVPACQPA